VKEREQEREREERVKRERGKRESRERERKSEREREKEKERQKREKRERDYSERGREGYQPLLLPLLPVANAAAPAAIQSTIIIRPTKRNSDPTSPNKSSPLHRTNQPSPPRSMEFEGQRRRKEAHQKSCCVGCRLLLFVL